jgi:hypothetical protein
MIVRADIENLGQFISASVQNDYKPADQYKNIAVISARNIPHEACWLRINLSELMIFSSVRPKPKQKLKKKQYYVQHYSGFCKFD